MTKQFDFDIMSEIKSRWSPRAFDSKAVVPEDLNALLEAARFAPSCNNEQPWRFLVADSEEKLAKMRSVLDPGNQAWANKAPVLILVAALKTFAKTGKDNFWKMFDAGTAWGYLSLEAEKRGMITHAMGGFDREKARAHFAIPQQYEVITVIALGYYGDKNELSEFNRAREHPQPRKKVNEITLT